MGARAVGTSATSLEVSEDGAGASAHSVLIAGSGNRPLAEAIAAELRVPLASTVTQRYPDGELQVRIEESVRGREVFLLQPISPPVNENLVELLALADAARRADADRVTAVVSYFGYARSDRRDGHRGPIMASLVAELMQSAGIAHVLTLDVHTPAVEGFFHVPVDNLSAVGLLAAAARPLLPANAVVVAPDLGAVRLATRYGAQLGLPVAICHKRRLGATEVAVSRVTGEVQGLSAIIVDDMVSTGSTIVESARALHEAGAATEFLVVATHGVLVPGAREKLAAAGATRLIVTDSLVVPRDERFAPQVVSVAPLCARAIRTLLGGGSLRDVG